MTQKPLQGDDQRVGEGCMSTQYVVVSASLSRLTIVGTQARDSMLCCSAFWNEFL